MTKFSFRRFVFAFLLLFVLAPGDSQAQTKEKAQASSDAGAALKGVAGPMVGHVTADGVQLWMYVPKGQSCTVYYRKKGSSEAESRAELEPVTQPIADATSEPRRVAIKGLSKQTSYVYRVQVDGKANPLWHGEFATSAEAGMPSRFRLALTSCMKIGQPQASWYLLLAQQPDLHLTVGDTHYADTTDPKIQWAHHLEYRRQPEFATVLRQIPTLSIWDDHDYGPNNSDGTAKGKESSLTGWKQFWANPSEGTAATPGAFFKFTRGEVEFFVVDERYHRSPDDAPDDANKRMLGDAQFNWLVNGLKASKAKFKVIASGSTLNHSGNDGWKIYTQARHRFFAAIKENNVSGVVYMSGDIHRSLVWEHHESKERVGYPLVEVISSGIANSKTLSFATVDFDTTLDDPAMRVRIVFGDGTVRDDRTWRLSQLSPQTKKPDPVDPASESTSDQK